ncbi:MAG: DUF2335 domain-containing protein [bacterium]
MAKDKKTETLDDSKTSESSPKGVPGQTFPDKKASSLRLTAQAEFSGPLPPSSELERYEKIYPGMAKALLDQYLQETTHRQFQETKQLSAAIQDAKRGQYFAFLMGMFCLGAAVWLGYFGHQWASAIVGPFGMSSVIASFLRRPKSPQNQEK